MSPRISCRWLEDPFLAAIGTWCVGTVLAGALVLTGSGLAVAQPTTTRVSVATGGAEAHGNSSGAAISADGRWVAFHSEASNLVASDTNGVADVFLHDRHTGTTTRVSVATGGAQGNDGSTFPSISADGRWVSFTSDASNLVVGDANGARDVFVHNRESVTTVRVSVASGGLEGNALSSTNSAVSADGRWIVFSSQASNLVGSDTNAVEDVLVHDMETGTTERVSVGTGGTQANDWSLSGPISADGRWVAFWSPATNLIPSDTNGQLDVFVHDRLTNVTSIVSVATGRMQGNGGSGAPSMSADGRWVAFGSSARNLVFNDTNLSPDAFVHDRQTGETSRVSEGNHGLEGNEYSGVSKISADGRWMAFESFASNLRPGDTNNSEDVLVHDRQTRTTTRVSIATDGTQANDDSWVPQISAVGRWVVFFSDANNLVPDDTNDAQDVFVHDRGSAGCAFALVPSSAVMPIGGGMGRLYVLSAAECAWTATSSDPSWLTVTGAASGMGFGTRLRVVRERVRRCQVGDAVVAPQAIGATKRRHAARGRHAGSGQDGDARRGPQARRQGRQSRRHHAVSAR